MIMIIRSKPSVSRTSDLWRLKADAIQDNAQFSGSIKVIVLIIFVIVIQMFTTLSEGVSTSALLFAFLLFSTVFVKKITKLSLFEGVSTSTIC